MDKLPNINHHEDKQEWWEESKVILKKGITKAKDKSPQVDVFDAMLDLVERMEIREVK